MRYVISCILAGLAAAALVNGCASRPTFTRDPNDAVMLVTWVDQDNRIVASTSIGYKTVGACKQAAPSVFMASRKIDPVLTDDVVVTCFRAATGDDAAPGTAI